MAPPKLRSKSKPGPAAHPTALKLLHGEKRPSRVSTAEPVPADVPIAPPRYLSPAALAVWNQYAPDLIRQQVMTAWDVEVFAAWCVAVVRHAEATELIDATQSLLIQSPTGRGPSVSKHPALQIERDQAMLITALGARFGLSPSDRSSIGKQGDADDPVDDLFS